ncbi:MAG: DNA polymerase I [Candidatus Dependentiae bacterium]|nr:DNA polymerase I [Candidatus Dependentiae bacterium]
MNLDPKKTVFLIDGSSFLYRAYYGVRPLHTPTGVPVQAVYSFCRMIKKLIDTFSPAAIVLVWDSKGKTTRHEMFPDYKATRQAPPSDIFDQKKLIVQFADMIGLPQIAQQGIEADDIMYSLALECKKNGDTVVFATSDKDMSQALDAQVVMYDAFKDEFLDVAAFEKKRGFPVEKLPFYFSILGDVSDNIPGVKGIGEKGATDLVKQFVSLQDMYDHIDLVKKDRTRILLQEQKENAFLSQKLFLLQYHPTGLTRENLLFDANNWPKAKPLFEELNFKTLLKGLDTVLQQGLSTAEEKIAKLKKYSFKTVTTTKELQELCYLLKDRKHFAIDTETTGVKPLQDTLVGVSLCVKEGESYYIPFGHNVDDVQLSRAEVIAALKPILEDAQYKKYLHHAKFDQLVLWHAGINVCGVVFDSYIAAALLVKEWQRAGLKDLSMTLLGEPMLTYEDVVTANKYKDFSYVPFELATMYAAADAHQTLRIKKLLEHALKEEKLLSLYETIEFPLVQILFEMEARGIYVDTALLAKLDVQITIALEFLEAEILALSGEHNKDINLGSPRQIEDLLFNQLKLPTQKKSAKGTSYSTDQEVLETLATMHPVPGLILKHRELSKLKNTYIDALPTYVNPTTNRIHTTYSQVAVATGRLASSSPNLQNIPSNSFGIRAAFKPAPGSVFLSADYSQIELRVLAYLSGDKALTNAFLSGHDIHAQTAAGLFDVPLDQITNEQRQIGKRINFSILYGLTPYGLSKDLDISFKDAKLYIDKYFQQYPQVSSWMASIVDQAKKDGYVTTLWGRRRYIPAIHERNRSLYEEACRMAINTVAQGTAAEIMKKGMIVLDAELKKYNLDAKMLLQIHDELLLEVPQDQQDDTVALVKKVLESVVDWTIPLVVTTRLGADWHEVSK